MPATAKPGSVRPAWIAADWGTTNLRLWAMDSDDQPLASVSSPDGMSSIANGQYEQALLKGIEPWLVSGEVTPVFACGMVGARQGWIEVIYTPVPCAPTDASRIQLAPTQDPRIRMLIIGGLCQPDPADVMRGEETQVAGWLLENPDFDGLLCMPGTHTKWVEVSAGHIQSFKTWMTGELYGLLATQSVLKHSVRSDELDGVVFASTVRQVISGAHSFAELFSVRATDLLHDASPQASRARLSGLLIGAEINAMCGNTNKKPVVLLGASGVVELYHEALGIIGAQVHLADATRLTLAGLTAVRLASPSA
ncbi:MAG: 2-dehydro-3-deoxygalactonokinase [Burkholderiaceae bacterium]